MTTGKQDQKRRRGRALGAALVLITVLALIFGFRRPWARPVPGVRIEPTRPIMEAGDFGANSGFALLVDAVTEPKGVLPPAGGPPIWAGTWQDAAAKLEWHPWPTEPPPAAAEDAKLEKYGPWTLAQCQDIERLAGLYEPKVALLDRALADPDLRVPSVVSSNARLRYLSDVRVLATWLCIDAQRRAAMGDYPGVVRDIDRVLGMADAICRGGGMLSFGMARRRAQEAADAAWQITARHDLPEAELAALSRTFLTRDETVEPLAELFRHEVLAAKEAAAEVYRERSLRWLNGSGPGPGSPPAQKMFSSFSFTLAHLAGSSYPATARHLDCCYQRLITFTERPYSATVDAELQDFTRGLMPSAIGFPGLLFHTRDPIGLLCASVYTSASENCLATAALRHATLRGMAVFCAIKAYNAKHGRLPDTLDDLVPDYLPSVPADPFDGAPMRYLRDRVPAMPPGVWAVYSISRGFIDDGGIAYSVGSTNNKRILNPDLVWPSRGYAAPGERR